MKKIKSYSLAISKCHNLITRKVISHIHSWFWRVGKPKMKLPVEPVAGKYMITVSHMVEMAKQLFWGPFIYFLLNLFLFYVCFCLHVCPCTMCVLDTSGS